MRIRFRASDFGQVAQSNSRSCKSKQASCAEMVLGSFVFCSCDSQLGFGTQKLQANINYCYVWRRAECASLGPGLQHPSLR